MPSPSGGTAILIRTAKRFSFRGEKLVVLRSSSSPLERTLTRGRSVLSFTQITPGDLDVAVIGQLATTHLPLRYQFEPSST